MPSGIDLNQLRESLMKGSSIVYSQAREEIPFFNVRKDISEVSNDRWESIVRLVVKPGTKGFASRVVHPAVGHPEKEPKNFACAKFHDKPCPICEVLELAKEPSIANKYMDWVVLKDGIPVHDDVAVPKVMSVMAPTALLLFLVIEPEHYKNAQSPPETRGFQKFWINKKSLVNRIQKLLKDYPDDYFTDPVNGHSIKVIFDKNVQASDMYSVQAWTPSTLDPETVKAAVDPEVFAPKLRTDKEIQDKLKDMFGAADILDFN